MKNNSFYDAFEKEYKKISENKAKACDPLVDNLMKMRSSKIATCFFFCFCLGILSGVIFKSFIIAIPFILIMILLAIKWYYNNKMLINNDIIVIETCCVDKKIDILNLGINKIYDFEPVDSKLFSDIITLSIANDDTNFFSKKSQKVKVGYNYYLAFKKNNENKFSNDNFLCLSRCVAND